MNTSPSIAAFHDSLKSKKTSVTDSVQRYLGAQKSSTLNAFITQGGDEALLRAKQLQDEFDKDPKIVEKYPLFGVPIALKDNIVTQGVRTTCASRILENYIPPYSATVVERLKQAGAIAVGKLNMDEFGMGGSNENSAYGAVTHPTHFDRVPGGSSGGAAAAVKAQLCMSALGTDTGGSIRLPASFCGVVGLKPTYGRVSRFGLVAFASSLDQIGPMTHTVDDAARILSVISGGDIHDSTCNPLPSFSSGGEGMRKPLEKLIVGVPEGFLSEGVQPAVKKSIEQSLDWLRSKGVTVRSVKMPHLQHSVAVYYLVAVSEASSNLSRFDGIRYGVRPSDVFSEADLDLDSYYKKVRALFGAEVKRRIILGTFALSTGYADAYYRRACQVRRLIQQDFDRAFQEVDYLLGPVAPTTAYKLGEKISDPLTMYLNDIFTIPANLAGIPALSLPCGKDDLGLPIGLQIMGKAFDESGVLQLGKTLEGGLPV